MDKPVLKQKNEFHDLTGEQENQLLVRVDVSGRKTGLVTRKECHMGEGLPHLAFIAFLFDGKKRMILAKRAKKKSLWGGFWDAAAVSHVLPGETAVGAAERRVKEELGIESEFKDIGAFYYKVKHHDGNSENEYCHILVGRTDKEAIPNPVEIQEVRKISFQQLSAELEEKKSIFTPWFILAMEKINQENYP